MAPAWSISARSTGRTDTPCRWKWCAPKAPESAAGPPCSGPRRRRSPGKRHDTGRQQAAIGWRDRMTKTGKTALSRRRVLKGGMALAGAVAMPSYLRAQGAPIKIGILQPVTGALAFDGAQGQIGAEAAIKAINDKGGIKSLGG